MTDEPTPKEIENLFVEETGFATDDFPAAIFGFARAVLEKWGQPAQAAEPFCWQWENTFNGGTGAVKKNPETLGINMSHPDYKWTALYTAPQPAHAQAGAVPLTPEQAQDLIELESWGPDAIGLNAQLLRTIRRTEAAHGIKGGQHGTE